MVIEKSLPYGAAIRLKFSMGIIYVSRIINIVVDFIFALIVTRKLTIREMSWWTILSNYLVYIGVFSTIYTFWASRAISRGWNVSKVVLRLGALIGGVLAVLSVPFMIFLSGEFGVYADLILLVSLVVLADYVIKSLFSISQGYAPQHIGIYNVVFAVARTGLAYFMIVMLRYGITGALAALLLSKVVVALVLFLLNKSLITGAIYDQAIALKWIKYSWYPLNLYLLDAISYFDVLIVGIITHNELLIAYFGVIRLLVPVIASIAEAIPSIYAKVLAMRDPRIIEEGIWFLLLMATPAIAVLLGIPEPIIAVLGTKYLPMSSYIWPFVIATGLNVFYVTLRNSMLAWESSDENIYEGIRFAKTIFFDLLIIDIIQVSSYLALLAVTVTLLTDTYVILLWWGVLMLTRYILSTLLAIAFSRRRFGLCLISSRSLVDIAKFSLVGLIVCIAGRFMKVEISEKIYEMLRLLIPPAAILLILYMCFALIIDRKTRNLAKTILSYAKRHF
ncbi:MAG: hypothetical protein NDP23_03165 [Crenarchaeota archaeon]|nr:hypothetical protein [Thermoproteota archaeon]